MDIESKMKLAREARSKWALLKGICVQYDRKSYSIYADAPPLSKEQKEAIGWLQSNLGYQFQYSLLTLS